MYDPSSYAIIGIIVLAGVAANGTLNQSWNRGVRTGDLYVALQSANVTFRASRELGDIPRLDAFHAMRLCHN